MERAKRWHVKVLNCDSPVNRSIQELAEKKKKKTIKWYPGILFLTELS